MAQNLQYYYLKIWNRDEHPELPVIHFTSIFGSQGQCARSFQLAILWLNALELLEGEGGAMRFACDEIYYMINILLP